MNLILIKQQQGVVLIFSLLILLLVTLVGVNMVQQNRLQFMMAANAQEQSIEFANAEDILRLAEMYIESQRYKVALPMIIPDPVKGTFTCNKTAGSPPKFDQLKPGDITNLIDMTEAMKAQSQVEIKKTSCMPIAGSEIECKADAANASGWDINELQCYQSDVAQCTTEIYEIKVSTTNTTGGNRIIEAKYAIRCDK
jgi:hypothetical protein